MQNNNKLDIIPCDEDSLIILDSNTGDSYLFNETGAQIVNKLNQACTIEEIIVTFNSLYEGDGETMQKEIQEFLHILLDNNIIVSI